MGRPAAALVALLCWPSAQALEDSSGPARASYDSAYFSAYSVSNAEDMVRLVPGGGAILDATSAANTARGFGAGGTQVLLDGRRFPGKANEIGGNLRRIAPAAVERIELISGTVNGVSAQSGGSLINVILREGARPGDLGSWEVSNRFSDTGRQQGFDGLASLSRSHVGWTWKLGIERGLWAPPALGMNRWSERTRAEAYFYPSGALQESRPQQWDREQDKWVYTGGLNFDFDSGRSLELNALFQSLEFVEADTTAFSRFSPAGAPGLSGIESHRRSSGPYSVLELSASFETALGAGAFDVLGIYRRDTSRDVEFRNQERNGRLFELSLSNGEIDRGEDIVRATWTRPLGPGRSLELGGEFARNSFDQFLQVSFDLNADGRVEPVAIPTARAQVEESRREAFATLRLANDRRVSLEAGVTYERSRIRTNYPFSPGRDLGYLRPRLDLRWNDPNNGQLRAAIERKISQLDFANFVPKFNVVDSRIDAGNPELRPEQSWSYELGYQRRFVKEEALVELRLFHDDISGAIERVPLRDAVGLYSAQGNIPDAKRQGAELKASARLQALHMPGALLSVRYLYLETRVPDPFTGQRRRLGFNFGSTLEVVLRHDVQRFGGSWGFSYKRFQDAALNSDLLVRSALQLGPLGEAFVEKKLPRGLVLRLEAQNIGHAWERQNRTHYLVNAIDGSVVRRDAYEERRDTRIALRLRGQF
jgi:outer membrane receptor for ferrienterochelin and colicins